MKVDGRPYRTIWVAKDGESVEIIDQAKLPWEFVVAKLATLDDAAAAIRDMQVRGAPLIGVAAAYGLCLGLRRDASDAGLLRASSVLEATRPTAVNLQSVPPIASPELTRWRPSSPTETSQRTLPSGNTAPRSCATFKRTRRTRRRPVS